MQKIIGAIVMSLAMQLAFAQDSAIGNETPTADQASDKAEVTTVAAVKEEEKEFQPPPGFVAKKRGSLVLYCKRDATIGTRFKTENCYSEDQVRDYIIAQRENKQNIDRIRNTCGSGTEACVHQ